MKLDETKSWMVDSLSDKRWQKSRARRLEQAAFDAWTGSGRIYQKGVWRDKETGKIVGYYCDVEDMIA